MTVPKTDPNNEDGGSDSDDMYKDHGSNDEAEEEAVVINEEKTNRTKTIPNSKSPKKEITELTGTQNILVSAATKYALLCGLTIVFICLQFLCQAIYNLMRGEGINYDIECALAVWFLLVLFLEFYSIYLSFPTTMGQYQLVCSGLHGVCEGIFRANMMNGIQRKEA